MEIERSQVAELMFQALETELGGVNVYETALKCAVNDDLKREWTKYLGQTREHVRVLLGVFDRLDLDPDTETPGRQVVRHIGASLVEAMTMARNSGGSPEGVQIVAAECIVNAETKDHMNWELVGQVARALGPEDGAVLKEAYDQVEDEEDEHLYHTKGWTRELWIASLGMGAVLPPPEEVKKVETAIGAAKAEASRDAMLGTQAPRQ